VPFQWRFVTRCRGLTAGIPIFVVFEHAVFANSIRVSFPVAFLAVQVRAILSPGQYEKLKTVRQRAIEGAIPKRRS
jgi:hypothetical protein